MSTTPVWLQALMARFPSRFRQGKLAYAFMFAWLIIGILLVFSAISPYAHARWLFLPMALLLVSLLLAIQRGLALVPAVHIATTAGLAVVMVAVWFAGGVFSPRLGWMLMLPLTPFYLHSRRAGMVWAGIVLAAQLAMGWFTATGRIVPFEVGEQHIPSSWATFSLVTGVLILVPFIYERQYRQALEDSRERQRELERQREALEHTLQMREYFIGTVSHELRTPMNAILGFNALLLSRVQDRPEALRVLNHTRQSADHLMTVINDILDYSQLQTGKLVVHPETFELRSVVEHAFELFRPRVQSMALDYQLVFDADLPQWVRTDRHRLMQVLVNLLGNAIKFTHQGSVRLRLSVREGGVEFSVSDTGIGMTAEQQASIFERFGQAHAQIQSQYGGNGLGLTISQRLVQLLGGTLQVHSQAGVGSRFVFWLPLQAVPAPMPAAQHPVAVAAAPSAHRFLVVDDHPVNRLLVRQALLQHWPGCAVHECADGAQALQWLADGQRCDLVLMDMVMPGMDGIEATQRLRAHPTWRHTPVLGLTANVNPQDLARFEAAGLDGLLLKPFELAQLRAQIERLLPAAPAAPRA